MYVLLCKIFPISVRKLLTCLDNTKLPLSNKRRTRTRIRKKTKLDVFTSIANTNKDEPLQTYNKDNSQKADH